MSSLFYDRMAQTANRLIDKYGRSITFRRATLSGSNFNPTVATEDFTATAAIIDYSSREIDGTNILAGDKRALVKVEDLEIEPQPTDICFIGGVKHKVVQVRPTNPGGTVVMYDVQLRR